MILSKESQYNSLTHPKSPDISSLQYEHPPNTILGETNVISRTNRKPWTGPMNSLSSSRIISVSHRHWGLHHLGCIPVDSPIVICKSLQPQSYTNDTKWSFHMDIKWLVLDVPPPVKATWLLWILLQYIVTEHVYIYIYRIANTHLSNEKNLGYLLYIGDYTTQLYGDYNKPL